MDDTTPTSRPAAEAAGTAPGRGRLAGRSVLVVGAGQRPCADEDGPIGNGRAISVLAAREGAAVACVDVDAASVQETVELVTGEGGEAHAIMADVTVPEDCERLVADAVTALGGLDAVALNVGAGAGYTLAGTTAADWDATFALNLRSHFLVAKAAMAVPVTSAIVFVSSAAALRPGSLIPAYDASKAGLLGLSRHVALEGARTGVRSNVVVPGLIDTPLGRLASAFRPERATAPIPLGRQGTGWEVAYATVFLLSDEVSYVTGHTLVVDGGLTSLS